MMTYNLEWMEHLDGVAVSLWIFKPNSLLNESCTIKPSPKLKKCMSMDTRTFVDLNL